MNFLQRLIWAYWNSQAQYLRGRLFELEIEAGHLERARTEVAQRLQRAENRCVQWGGL